MLRVPILYGELEFVSESAVTFIFNAVKDSSKESIQDHYARRYPTDVADIASVIRQLLEKKMEVSHHGLQCLFFSLLNFLSMTLPKTVVLHYISNGVTTG